jgi:coenzyme F420-0:L-glutamate ligase
LKAPLQLCALPELPMVQVGDDLAGLLSAAMARAGLRPQQGDVLAVAQKIVSKAEGRSVALASVKPSVAARELAEQTGKDARLVELILSESERVVRARPNLIIVKHQLGFVMANAGIDQSNIGVDGHALLLPRDPDGSAAALAARLGLPVVITDSFGRAWRRGCVHAVQPDVAHELEVVVVVRLLRLAGLGLEMGDVGRHRCRNVVTIRPGRGDDPVGDELGYVIFGDTE